MNKSYAQMAKLFNFFNSMFVSGLFILFCYFLGKGVYDFYQGTDEEAIFSLVYAILVFIWMNTTIYIANKIELKLYKENFDHLFEWMIIHSLLLGVINPIVFYNYYIIANIGKIFNQNFSITVQVNDQKYYIPKLVLKLGTYCFLGYILFRYYYLYKAIYFYFIFDKGKVTQYSLFYAVWIIFCLVLLRIADREIDQRKFVMSASRMLFVAIFANPFSFHGPLLIAGGGFILYYQVKSGELAIKWEQLKKWVSIK